MLIASTITRYYFSGDTLSNRERSHAYGCCYIALTPPELSIYTCLTLWSSIVGICIHSRCSVSSWFY